jgi:hypothetical protein
VLSLLAYRQMLEHPVGPLEAHVEALCRRHRVVGNLSSVAHPARRYGRQLELAVYIYL